MRQIRDQGILAADAEFSVKNTLPARSSIEEKSTEVSRRPDELISSLDHHYPSPARGWKWVLMISIFLVHFFKYHTLLILFIQFVSFGGVVFIPIYFIYLFFQFTRQDKALEAGVHLLPFLAMFVLFVILNSAIMTKEGHYMPWYIGGTIPMIVRTARMSRINENTSTSAIYGYSVITAIGAGSIFRASFSLAQALVPKADVQLIVAFINIAQIAGITLALVLANSVFLNLVIQKISAILPPGTPLSTIQATITGTGGSALIQALSKEVQERILHAVIESMSRAYYFTLAGAVVGFLAVLGMKWEKILMSVAA